MADILNSQADLELFIQDFNTFKNGGSSSDVTLHDGAVIPSYLKYAISDLERSGNALQNRLYYKGDIISKDGDIYVCLNNVEVSGLILNPSFWKKQGNPLVSEISGNGISAYLEFDFHSNTILNSSNIASVVSNVSTGELEIKLSQTIDPNLKLCVVSSVDVRQIPYSDISNPNYVGSWGQEHWTNPNYNNDSNYNYTTPDGYYKKMVGGRTIQNIGSGTYKVSIRQGGYITHTNYDFSVNTITPTSKTTNFLNSGQISIFKPVVSFLFIAY